MVPHFIRGPTRLSGKKILIKKKKPTTYDFCQKLEFSGRYILVIFSKSRVMAPQAHTLVASVLTQPHTQSLTTLQYSLT